MDRSGSYIAQYGAKNIVAAGLADKCDVQIAYAIGVSKPVSVMVYTYGTGKKKDNKNYGGSEISFRHDPQGNNRAPKPPTAHLQKNGNLRTFRAGRSQFTWERTDKVDELKRYA